MFGAAKFFGDADFDQAEFLSYAHFDRAEFSGNAIFTDRVHLDVRVGTGLVEEERLVMLEAECARLVALGATHLQTLHANEENESCIPMLDIEGNEFCID